MDHGFGLTALFDGADHVPDNAISGVRVVVPSQYAAGLLDMSHTMTCFRPHAKKSVILNEIVMAVRVGAPQ